MLELKVFISLKAHISQDRFDTHYYSISKISHEGHLTSFFLETSYPSKNTLT